MSFKSLAEEPVPAGFEPTRMIELELSQTLPTLEALDERTGRRYRQARALVRLHTRPLGLVDLELGEAGLAPEVYSGQIWDKVSEAINEHLRGDGLAEASELMTGGLTCAGMPACLQARAAFLMRAPQLSIVLCTRDRPEQLAMCLPTLLAQEYPDYEIIVVDNAPRTTATAELICDRYGGEPRVRYVREERPGLGWARNCGLHEARGEIVAYIDDDALADRHWLAELASGFTRAEDVACVGGLILPAELETPAQAWFEQFGSYTSEFYTIVHNVTARPLNRPLYPYTAIRYGAGGNVAYKVSALRALDGFDPAFGSGTPACGGEDITMYMSVLARNYTAVYEPAAIVRHFHRRDYAGLQRTVYGYGVAFSAFAIRTWLHHPGLFWRLLRQLPRAFYELLNPRSRKNARKEAGFPAELTRLERRGWLYGPVAYFRSWWRTRQMARPSRPSEDALARAIPGQSTR